MLVSQRVAENENYVARLRREYEVDATAYIETALIKLTKPERYSLIIIEISMPPHDLYSLEETSDGLKTGIVFYEKNVKHLNIPVILWSWDDQFKDEISRFEGLVVFVEKEMDGDSQFALDKDGLLVAVKKFIGKL